MIIHKSLDNSNNYLITDVNYEILTIIHSSLVVKSKSINSRTKKTQSLLTEYSDKKVIHQFKKEILYLQELNNKLDDTIQIIKKTLENI